jgi:hypothetical protein
MSYYECMKLLFKSIKYILKTLLTTKLFYCSIMPNESHLLIQTYFCFIMQTAKFPKFCFT